MTEHEKRPWPLIENDEELYEFPIGAVHLGEAFTSGEGSRPMLAHLYVDIADGVMKAGASDGYCAATMKARIDPYDRRKDDEGNYKVAPANARFFLHRDGLKVLRQMPKPVGQQHVFMAVSTSGRVRLGHPKLGVWVQEARFDGSFPDIDLLVPTETKKLDGLTMGQPVLARINRFAAKIHAEWMNLRAASATTAILVEMRSHAGQIEDYNVILMPMVRSM
jgi:hypothetical protein